MSKTKPKNGHRLVRAGIATAAVTAAVVSTAASPALAASTALTLSSAVGPSATVNNITASAATAWLAGVSAPVVALSLPACQTVNNTTASTGVTPSTATTGNIVAGITVTKLTDYKIALALPATVIQAPSSATTTKYNICVYAGSGATDALVGSATYTVAAPITLTSIDKASGPSLGGTLVTVTGSAFPTTKGAITGTLGGTAIENVNPISTTSFTFTTPSHTSSTTPVSLAVTTAAGTKSLASVFTYANGISIAPNAADNTKNAVYVDISGAGFSALSASWAAAAAHPLPYATPTGSRVLLVPGAYSTSAGGGTYNGGLEECIGVVPISDAEIICHMDLTDSLDPTDPTASLTGNPATNGTYTLTVVADSTPGATMAVANPSDISSGSTFTVAPY